MTFALGRPMRLRAGALFASTVLLLACGTAPDDPPPDGGLRPDGGVPQDGGARDAGTCPAPWPDTSIDGPRDDEVLALAIDGASRLVVAGYRGGGNLGRLMPDGDANAFVSWWSPDGAQLAEVSFATHGADVVEAINVGDDDLVRIAGRTTGGLFSPTPGGQYDLFFAAVHPEAPVPHFGLQIGDAHPLHPRGLLVEGAQWIATGFTDIYVPTNYVEDWEDPFIARATFDGARLVDGRFERWPSPITDVMQGAVHTGDDTGDLIVTYFAQVGARRGAWLERVTADGTHRWRTHVSNTGFDSSVAVLLDGQGHVDLVGTTFGVIGERSYGQQDVYVASVRLDDGSVRHVMQVGSEESDWVTAAVRGPDGALYVTGQTFGAWYGAPLPEEAVAAFVVRIADGVATSAWQSAPTMEPMLPQAIVIDACDRVLIGGYETNDGHRAGFVRAVELSRWP
jgi:hypothetical protein